MPSTRSDPDAIRRWLNDIRHHIGIDVWKIDASVQLSLWTPEQLLKHRNIRINE